MLWHNGELIKPPIIIALQLPSMIFSFGFAYAFLLSSLFNGDVVMLTVGEILDGKVSLDIECVDRMYLNGYVKYLQMPGGVINFIREQFGWPIPSPKGMYQTSDKFRQAVKDFAAEQGLEIYTFSKGEDKEKVAHQHAERLQRKHGVVLIGKAQEKASTYGARRDDQDGKVWFKYFRRSVNVIHYYFYIMDKEFNLFFIKVCTYFPFEVKVCFNGHEWAKQQLRKEGIKFEPLSNGFASCEDPQRLKEICDQLNLEKIQILFDSWVEQLPWPLTRRQRECGYKHLLSIWQMEISLTQVFADPEQGRALVENLIRDNLDLGRPERVSLIFDRRVTKRTPSEFYTRIIRKGVLPCIKIGYKHSELKQYFKDGLALRTEMMINNPRDFDCPRGIAHFDRLRELGRQINRRLLEQERLSQDCYVPIGEVRLLSQSTVTTGGQRASALRFGDQRVMAVFAALLNHSHLPGKMRNKTLRQSVAQLLGVPDSQYTSAKMSYDLRRLRLKGLIERIANSQSYKLTELGAKTATFFVKLYERLFRPGLAALVPNQTFPSDLAQVLNKIAQVIEEWTKLALITNPVTA